MIDRRQLRQFLAVMETGNLRRASQVLNISQPAVTKTIRLLEDHFQVKLFERSVKGMRATSHGKVLYEHAHAIEIDFRLAQEEMDDLRGVRKGTLTVGASPSVVQSLLGPVSQSLSSRHPDLVLNVIEGTRDTWLPMLHSGAVDAVLATPPAQSAEVLIDTRLIFHDEIAIVMSAAHPLTKMKNPGLEHLLNVDWAAPARTEEFTRQGLRDVFSASGLRLPRAKVETNSATHLRWLVLNANYVAFLPRLLFLHEIRDGSCLIFPVTGSAMAHAVAILQRRQRPQAPGMLPFVNAVECAAQALGLALTNKEE